MLFWPILGHFWCLVVTLVTVSSYLSDFEKKRRKKIQTNSINPKIFKKNPKKTENPKKNHFLKCRKKYKIKTSIKKTQKSKTVKKMSKMVQISENLKKSYFFLLFSKILNILKKKNKNC